MNSRHTDHDKSVTDYSPTN